MWRPAVKPFDLSFTDDILSTSDIRYTASSGGNTVLISYKEEFLHAVSAPQDVFML